MIAFAATMMFLIGIFQAIPGLVAIFDDEFYVVIGLDIWVIWALTRPGAIRT